jgi:ech hydrogenase subunit D
MFEMDKLKEVTKDTVHQEVARYRGSGYRFVTMSCSYNPKTEKIEMFYHFDKACNKEHLKLVMDKSDSLESISSIYFAACLVENEIQEHFGIVFHNKAIDFGGRFIMAEDAPETPYLSNDFKVNK